MKNIFKRFDIRVVVAIVATLSCVVIASDFILFRFTYQAQFEGMRSQLKIIAQTAALLVDADKLTQVPLNKEGISTPQFDYVEALSGAAAWAVALYLRSQRPAWITTGAGARIGLVTGLVGAWLAFGVSGGALFVQRVVLHQSSQIDGEWKTNIAAGEQMTQQLASGMGPALAAQEEAAQAQNRVWMLSPEGHAGGQAFNLAISSGFLLLFAVAGGALGARLQARARRPQA